jgi:SAM-dependent methyltransferase
LDKNPKKYWEEKLLSWEQARYSRWASAHPFAWTVRSRFFKASKLISERIPKGSSVFEIGCGSGLLAERLVDIAGQYKGIDIAENAIQLARTRVNHPKFEFYAGDLLDLEYEPADLTVLLGVVDWLDPKGVDHMISKIQSKLILISHTQASQWSPYTLYRKIVDDPNSTDRYGAQNYSVQQLRTIVEKNGYTLEPVTSPSLWNPGALVWSSR